MADNKSSDENNVMDYAEHERTYEMFITGSKLLTVVSCAILIAMAFGFFAGFGFLGSVAVFIIICILAKIMM